MTMATTLKKNLNKMRKNAMTLHRQYLQCLHLCDNDAHRDEVTEELKRLNSMTMVLGQSYYDVDIFDIKGVQ